MALPTVTQINQQFNVQISGVYDAITQDLYDFQAYAAAGATSFSFFQLPIGQSSKTSDDTNMQLAGQIPASQFFLMQSAEVVFYPTVPAVTAQNPAAFGAQAAAAIINDVYAVYHAGTFLLSIANKNYLTVAPIGRLPPKTHMQVMGALADATTAAAASQSRIAFAYPAGRPYMVNPLLILPNNAFLAQVTFAAAVAITNPARIGVVLDGVLYRQAQ